MTTLRIPLFPLEVVLFPGGTLPLHIFEPRYKLMIQESLDGSGPFGIVLARERGIATVGCTATVARVVQTYDDGRMDIIATGETAYRIAEVHDEKPYYEGTVELLEDDVQPPPAGVSGELRSLFSQCHMLIRHSAPPSISAEPGRSLAYQIAATLPLSLVTLQQLLEIRAEAERQTSLIETLKQLLPQLARLQQMRSKVSGNGHGLN